MTTTVRHTVPAFLHLRRLLVRPDADGTSDAQLLERFVRQRDESAFELLVWRHGPMVHGVCRRVLRHAAPARDALPAALLLLPPQAARPRPKGRLDRPAGVGGRLALPGGLPGRPARPGVCGPAGPARATRPPAAGGGRPAPRRASR